MRTKFISVALVIGILAMLLLYFLLRTFYYPADNMFLDARISIPHSATDTLLMPEQVSVFQRQSIDIVPVDKSFSGLAIYTLGNNKIKLVLSPIPSKMNFSQFWSGNYLSLTCGDIEGRVITHPEVKTPYRYASCSGINFIYHEYKWINGNWSITASGENIDTLVQFINAYPY